MRSGLFFCVLGLSWGGIGGCLSPPDADDGVLRVAIDREPLTWNRLLADELMTHIVTEQLHAPLIRLNPETQEMEPALAESWTFNDDGDGSVLEFRLREGVRFSDGAPFSAADVSFTFDVLADPRAGSPLTDSARIDGEVLSPEVVDPLTVRFHLPRRTATVERVFDGIRILPKHKLAESSSAGTVAADTALGVASEDVVGLGPFRLKEHVSGQRIELERNPHYYRASQGYPRLQAIVFHVVSDPNAQRLRLQAGEIDVLARTTSDTFVALQRELDASADADADANIVIEDLGPSLLSERLWFNLNPESPIESRKKEWFADIRFRRAVSLAIDRTEMARIVFESLASPAEGAVSVGNTFWQDRELMPLEHDIARARALLGEAGFTLREDALFDSHGNRVRFSVSTTAGNPQRLREVAFIQEDLARLGIEVVAAPIEGGAFIARVTRSFDYDAGLLGFTLTDPDPNSEMALWMSSGPLHLWYPAQDRPATRWEARIDEIMGAQAGETDQARRWAMYQELQQIVAEHLPILDLVVPHALAAYRRDVQHLRPTPFGHVLWNADAIDVVRREKTPR